MGIGAADKRITELRLEAVVIHYTAHERRAAKLTVPSTSSDVSPNKRGHDKQAGSWGGCKFLFNHMVGMMDISNPLERCPEKPGEWFSITATPSTTDWYSVGQDQGRFIGALRDRIEPKMSYKSVIVNDVRNAIFNGGGIMCEVRNTFAWIWNASLGLVLCLANEGENLREKFTPLQPVFFSASTFVENRFFGFCANSVEPAKTCFARNIYSAKAKKVEFVDSKMLAVCPNGHTVVVLRGDLSLAHPDEFTNLKSNGLSLIYRKVYTVMGPMFVSIFASDERIYEDVIDRARTFGYEFSEEQYKHIWFDIWRAPKSALSELKVTFKQVLDIWSIDEDFGFYERFIPSEFDITPLRFWEELDERYMRGNADEDADLKDFAKLKLLDPDEDENIEYAEVPDVSEYVSSPLFSDTANNVLPVRIEDGDVVGVRLSEEEAAIFANLQMARATKPKPRNRSSYLTQKNFQNLKVPATSRSSAASSQTMFIKAKLKTLGSVSSNSKAMPPKPHSQIQPPPVSAASDSSAVVEKSELPVYNSRSEYRQNSQNVSVSLGASIEQSSYTGPELAKSSQTVTAPMSDRTDVKFKSPSSSTDKPSSYSKTIVMPSYEGGRNYPPVDPSSRSESYQSNYRSRVSEEPQRFQQAPPRVQQEPQHFQQEHQRIQQEHQYFQQEPMCSQEDTRARQDTQFVHERPTRYDDRIPVRQSSDFSITNLRDHAIQESFEARTDNREVSAPTASATSKARRWVPFNKIQSNASSDSYSIPNSHASAFKDLQSHTSSGPGTRKQ